MESLAEDQNNTADGMTPSPESPALGGLHLHSLTDWAIVALLVAIIIVSFVGNCLVCIAIGTDRRLRRLGNAFIVSLAIADLFVSCLVMTFALCNDLLDYWIFGDWLCDVWISFDIMCCTASILNLCAISFDRFIHIKDCLLYDQWMTSRVALGTVLIIWFISALVSFVPITLGWHKPDYFLASTRTRLPPSLQMRANTSKVADHNHSRLLSDDYLIEPLPRLHKFVGKLDYTSGGGQNDAMPPTGEHRPTEVGLSFRQRPVASGVASDKNRWLNIMSAKADKATKTIATRRESIARQPANSSPSLTDQYPSMSLPAPSRTLIGDKKRRPRVRESRSASHASAQKSYSTATWPPITASADQEVKLHMLYNYQDEPGNINSHYGLAAAIKMAPASSTVNSTVHFQPNIPSRPTLLLEAKQAPRMINSEKLNSPFNRPLPVQRSIKVREVDAVVSKLQVSVPLPHQLTDDSFNPTPFAGNEYNNPQCILTLTPTYAVVSSTISFYIPCIIMLGLYSKLFACARKHTRSIQAVSRAPRSLPTDSSFNLTLSTPVTAELAFPNPILSLQRLSSSSIVSSTLKRLRHIGSHIRQSRLSLSLGLGSNSRVSDIVSDVPIAQLDAQSTKLRRVMHISESALALGPSYGSENNEEKQDSNASALRRPLRNSSGSCTAEPRIGQPSTCPVLLQHSKVQVRSADQLNIDLSRRVSFGQESGSEVERESLLAVRRGDNTNGVANNKPPTDANSTKMPLIDNDVFLDPNKLICAKNDHANQRTRDPFPDSGICASSITGRITLQQQRRQQQKQQGQSGQKPSHKLRFGSIRHMNNKKARFQNQQQSGQLATHKAAITLGIIMGTFLFCWVPFFCLNITKAFCIDCIPNSLFRAFTWLGYANSALNPIIYGIHNSEFRNAFNRIFFKHFNIRSSSHQLNRRCSYDLRHASRRATDRARKSVPGRIYFREVSQRQDDADSSRQPAIS